MAGKAAREAFLIPARRTAPAGDDWLLSFLPSVLPAGVCSFHLPAFVLCLFPFLLFAAPGSFVPLPAVFCSSTQTAPAGSGFSFFPPTVFLSAEKSGKRTKLKEQARSSARSSGICLPRV